MSTLAIDGGAPTRTAPLAPWPVVADDEIAAVTAVLRSGKINYWTGNETREFEREYADALGVKHTIAVANGTVSLELLLHAHGIHCGDEVIVTPRSFMASVSAPYARGCRPVFADIDADTQALSAETIAPKITDKTRAIIVVHLGGMPADMAPIMDLAAAHDLIVIEDCAQAHGATYRGQALGTIGHSGSWSFCQDKILTTGGEGGLIATNDEDVWRSAWAYKDHGKSYDAVYERQHPPGYRWLIESFGTNMRMTEMQGALGRVVLSKLPEWSATRRRHAERLTARLQHVSALRIPTVPDDVQHAWYKYYAFVRPDALAQGWDRDRIMNAIHAEGIPCFSGSCSELYLEKAVPAALRPDAPLPVAKTLGETSLMWMVHPTLSDAEIDDTATAIERVFARATR